MLRGGSDEVSMEQEELFEAMGITVLAVTTVGRPQQRTECALALAGGGSALSSCIFDGVPCVRQHGNVRWLGNTHLRVLVWWIVMSNSNGDFLCHEVLEEYRGLIHAEWHRETVLPQDKCACESPANVGSSMSVEDTG